MFACSYLCCLFVKTNDRDSQFNLLANCSCHVCCSVFQGSFGSRLPGSGCWVQLPPVSTCLPAAWASLHYLPPLLWAGLPACSKVAGLLLSVCSPVAGLHCLSVTSVACSAPVCPPHERVESESAAERRRRRRATAMSHDEPCLFNCLFV